MSAASLTLACLVPGQWAWTSTRTSPCATTLAPAIAIGGFEATAFPTTLCYASYPRVKRAIPDTTMGSQPRREGIRVFEAIYEDGVLKPVDDPGLPEHHRFSVQVQEVGEGSGTETLAAWHRVYEGLSDEDQAAVEVIALDRSRFSRSQPE